MAHLATSQAPTSGRAASNPLVICCAMSPFTYLDIRDTGRINAYGRVEYELLRDFTYKNPILTVRVPSGFITDFASVPWPFWFIFPPTGKYSRAAVTHDFLYVHKLVSRYLADSIFRDAMRELGVGFVRRWFMFAAVRLFGPRYEVAA